MALETNFNVAPYFDDYNETKDFYKILFRPGVAVQARELNQFQSILQKQIERFGDNIFKRGTIIDGCNFNFYPSYQYIKLVDQQKDGLTAIPSNYVGYFAKSVNPSIGVNAYIINYADGFVSTYPDLKTIYLNYINSGANGSTNTFTAGETISIYDPNYPLFGISANNGGVGFSNSDPVVISPALIVNVSSGSFTNTEYLYQPFTGANVQIIGIDTTTLADTQQVILRVKPRNTDLIDPIAKSTRWTIANGYPIRNAGSTVTADVEGLLGSDASAIIVTDSSGKVTDVTVTSLGNGYETLPHVTVKSSNNSSGLSTLNLQPRNYIANVQISTLPNSVGNGYAFAVGDGIVYQKGYFSKVTPQTVIVSKYSQTPDALVVGFDTAESIIDSNIDTSLLDNAQGTENENAPGANRLKLTPELMVASTSDAAANDNFFSLVEWSEGRPYKQNQQTAYNKINDEMARRTSDESGDYVIDKFLVTTRSPANSSLEGNTFTVLVDPGTAYIDGYRVETKSNYAINVRKGNDYRTVNNHAVTLNYGNYIRVKEVGGLFQYSTGDVIKLYDIAKNFISNTVAAVSGNTANAAGSVQIGTARIRSMLHYSGIVGTADSTYKLYLFDVNMNLGKNFRDVKSVYYDGTNKGIADVITKLDAAVGTNIAFIEETSNSTLLFPSGIYSVKSSANSTYNYRTIDQNISIANSGSLTKDISSISGEYYTFVGAAAPSDLQDMYLVPTSAGLVASLSASGDVSVNTTSPNVVGTSTTFSNDFQAGDFVYISNGSSNSAKRIVSITNNTLMVLDSNPSYANASNKIYRYFPKNVPISMGIRAVSGQYSHTGNVDANGNILTLKFKHANNTDMTFNAISGTTASLGVDVQRRNVNSLTVNARRSAYVKLRLANVAGSNAGPWCLGVPNAFRLRSVYVGNSTVNATGFSDAIDDFYIDHNQTADYNGLSYLYKAPDSPLNLDATNDYLLVKFDYGISTGVGYTDTTSYTGDANSEAVAINDGLPLSSLTTKYNSFEIPEVYTKNGKYYDLINTFDFRPSVSNTVSPNTTWSNAPLNPSNTISFGVTSDPANDRKFPIPGSIFKTKLDYYVGRVDSVFVDREGDIFTTKGTPALARGDKLATGNKLTKLIPVKPDYSMRLNNLIIPPYPNMPINPSNNMLAIINRNIANENKSNARIESRVVDVPLTAANIEEQQPTGYTMKDIGNLDRRIQDLEYYVSLTLLEKDIKEKTIPSSSAPTLSRFKYGFFVDDFSTTNNSDLNHKSYAASIQNDDALPEKSLFTLKSRIAALHQDYFEYPAVSQVNATLYTPALPPNGNGTGNTGGGNTGGGNTGGGNTGGGNTGGGGGGLVNTTPIVANTWLTVTNPSYSAMYLLLPSLFASSLITTTNFTMANTAGPVTLFGHFYSGHDAIEVYQGNTLIRTSSNSSQLAQLTTTDKTKLLSNVVPGKWFNGITFVNYTTAAKSMTSPSSWSGNAVNNSFKFTWDHNPSAGLQYTVKVRLFSTIWRYAVEYPGSNITVSNTVTTNVSVTPTIYTGTMTITPASVDTHWR